MVDHLVLSLPFSIEALGPTLQHDLRKAKIKSLSMRVPEELTSEFESEGWERRLGLSKLTAPMMETKFMTILPSSSPAEGDIAPLAKLMFDSYEKSSGL